MTNDHDSRVPGAGSRARAAAPIQLRDTRRRPGLPPADLLEETPPARKASWPETTGRRGLTQHVARCLEVRLLRQIRDWSVLEVQLERLARVAERLLDRLALAGNRDLETVHDTPGGFVRDLGRRAHHPVLVAKAA